MQNILFTDLDYGIWTVKEATLVSISVSPRLWDLYLTGHLVKSVVYMVGNHTMALVLTKFIEQ